MVFEMLTKNTTWFLYNNSVTKIIEIKILGDGQIKMDNITLQYFNDKKNNSIEIYSVVPNVNAYITKVNSRTLEYKEFIDEILVYAAYIIS